MLLTQAAHAMSDTRAPDGCRYAVTMRNRGEHGLLIWAGHLDPAAEGKSAEEIVASDYKSRQTLNLAQWHDVRMHFDHTPYSELVVELIASYKRREWAPGITPGWAKEGH